MKIEVLGSGCAKCRTLAENAKTAIEELGLDCEIVKVTDIDEIVSRGIMMTPALVVDGLVKTMGKAAGVKEIRELLAATCR
jgi:small redox-active disulfide protein 2